MGIVKISRKRYDELLSAEKRLRDMLDNHSRAGKISAAKLTQKQLSDRAKKAVAARIAKYGQNKVK